MLNMEKLTKGQKQKLASAIKNQSPLTLRLKHAHLRGNDELMLTNRQITKIKKAITQGKGTDIKISKNQIRKAVKYEVYFRVWLHSVQRFSLML